MANLLQTTSPNGFSSLRSFVISLKWQRSLFPRLQLATNLHQTCNRAITQTNVNQDVWHHMALLGHNALNPSDTLILPGKKMVAPSLVDTFQFKLLSPAHATMTSSNGNIFRVTGPLCREFTGHCWIPRTKTGDVELRCFLDLRLNKRLRK